MEDEGNRGDATVSRGVLSKIGTAAAFLLVGGLCFSAGLFTQAWQEPGKLEVAIVSPGEAKSLPEPLPAVNAGDQPAASGEEAAEKPVLAPAPENCTYVGSKNSDKYHLPTCSYAKRILPENRICFSTTGEAEARGYKAGCLK